MFHVPAPEKQRSLSNVYNEMGLPGGASIKFHQSRKESSKTMTPSFLLGTDLALSEETQHAGLSTEKITPEPLPSDGPGQPAAQAPPTAQKPAASPRFPLNELNDEPPLLEPSGWHPRSGTPEERKSAVAHFGLDLAANNCDDMKRWYQGDSPFKALSGPPHGGVAFGIAYSGSEFSDPPHVSI